MASISLQQVAEAVVRRAQRQGSIGTRDVRAELRLAGLPETRWKDTLALARPALLYRQGRYYHKDSFSPRLLQERARQQVIGKLIRQLVRRHLHQSRNDERRGQARVDFVQPIHVRTEDGKQHALLSRDLSPTGIRLLGTRRLLGQKVQVLLPRGTNEPPLRVVTRILWTCAVGDDLFENGGTFLELIEQDDDR